MLRHLVTNIPNADGDVKPIFFFLHSVIKKLTIVNRKKYMLKEACSKEDFWNTHWMKVTHDY